jgi:hypothetical protein
MAEETQAQTEESMSDEEAIMKIAAAMKDAPSTEDKSNVHTFLLNVVQEENIKHISKIGNLRDDKEMNELGKPIWNVRGSLGMALIADKIMDNDFFKDFFEADAGITLGTSLSREGFIIKHATLTTKQVVDATKRRKVNKGMFGKRSIEESGGDITSKNYQD